MSGQIEPDSTGFIASDKRCENDLLAQAQVDDWVDQESCFNTGGVVPGPQPFIRDVNEQIIPLGEIGGWLKRRT